MARKLLGLGISIVSKLKSFDGGSALLRDVADDVSNGVSLVAEMAIGDIVRKNVPLLVAKSGQLEQSLLGMNFIGSLSGFDVRGDRLVLRD